MKKTYAHRFAVILAMLLLAPGCSYYSFSGSLPAHLKTVAVPLFGNSEQRVLIYGVEESLTDALIEGFVKDGNLKVVDRSSADSRILGEIVQILEEPFTYTADEQAKQWKVRIFVAVTYEEVKKKETRWEEKSLEGWGVYEVVTGDPDERQTGVDAAIAMLVEDILDRTVAGW
ncbi:MAG: LptE family protein [Candidatus Latescibacterota bacterium]